MTAAFFLMIVTWTNAGPMFAMQDMASAEACNVARSYVYKHAIPDGNSNVIVKCVNKTTGEAQ